MGRVPQSASGGSPNGEAAPSRPAGPSQGHSGWRGRGPAPSIAVMSSPDADPSAGQAEAIRAARAPLRRSSYDRVLYGVCGGLAERYGVSATALRIAFALLALTGVGVAVYVVIAIACPAQDDAQPAGAARVLVALVAGLVALAASARSCTPPGSAASGSGAAARRS